MGRLSFGEREASNSLGIEQQSDKVRPPAQQGIGVGNNNTININDHMAMFALYMRRYYQAPHFPSAMPLPLPVARKKREDALTIGVAVETLAAMTGFIPDPHGEKKKNKRKVQVTQKTSYLWTFVETLLIQR
ncbi:hypothetical protein IV203_023550 [Nitzschia inconspicua]|uniref:Uncharacterized protein n=1 Tax=Nitzschia inconspicua TaxID=303405 RepID=A0A9K3KD97_9STRA|nr:hypothetical protein IV203_023550 [Nitzschia inconspicua]